MSQESQVIFEEALAAFRPGDNPASLQAAAAQHLACTRPLEKLTVLYARTLEAGDHQLAQEIADELASVRAAQRIVSVVLPRTAHGVE